MDNRKSKTLGIICVLIALMLSGCVGKKVYSVSFIDSYSGSQSYSPITVNHGDKLQQPATPEREGYVFDGWYQDKAEPLNGTLMKIK